MVILALILIVAAAVVGVGVVIENTGSSSLDFFGVTVTTTEAGVFIAGAITMLALLAGLWLLKLAARRSRKRRSEVKTLRETRKEQVARLEAENAELAGRLEREQEDRQAAMPPPADDAAQDRADERAANRARHEAEAGPQDEPVPVRPPESAGQHGAHAADR